MDGGTILQIVGGQIGGMSMLLEQIGCIAPLTQAQWHPANAGAEAKGVSRTATAKKRFIMKPLKKL